jgi:gamma-glutamyltranspeptidase/glutathione hydrolase
MSSAAPEPTHTNNIVATDNWGDIVVYTNTINFFGGSGETVPGYGFLLNDEMTDFDFAPSTPGARDPNLPAGGKIPRSSMGPVIAFRHRKPVFAIGAAGGSTIITTVVQTLINHVDFGMSLPAALAAPRVSQTNSTTSLAEPAFYNSSLARQLHRQFGERFTEATGPILPLNHYPGDATALQILSHGRAEAIAEPVRLGGGSALAVHPPARTAQSCRTRCGTSPTTASTTGQRRSARPAHGDRALATRRAARRPLRPGDARPRAARPAK